VTADKERAQLTAELGGVGSLTVGIDLNTDCPGQVYPWFSRGGILDNQMSVEEFERASVVLGELLVIGQANWPKLFKEVGA